MRKKELIELLERIEGNPEIMVLSKPTIYTGLDKVDIIVLPYNGNNAVLLKPLGVSVSETIVNEYRKNTNRVSMPVLS